MTKEERGTSWGGVTEWYSSYIEGEGTYQSTVILPNLLRLLGKKKGLRVLDVACGQGFFTRAFHTAGYDVVGADISPELIAEARKLSPPNIPYFVAPAGKLAFAKRASYDAVTIVLAIQNIKDIAEAFIEARRVLVPSGRLYMVLMHPAFRVPKNSSWGYDEVAGVQYRRVDRYLSEQQAELVVHPGKKDSPVTRSYHRSLQDFSKALGKADFAITKIEEWISPKVSQKGPRQVAEDTARKEIPLFMLIEAQ